MTGPDRRSMQEAFERYIERGRAQDVATTVDQPEDPPLRGLLKRYAGRVQLPLRLAATNMLRPRERRRAAKLSGHSDLRLHLGSGREPKEGWVNVDLFGDLWNPVDLAWNLKHPLPFPDASVDAIFHEHVLEHLPLAAGLQMHKECHRLLAPGGVLRVGVPDAGAYARSYVDGGKGMIEDVRPGRPTPMLALQELFYWHEHQTMYDDETLTMMLRAAGFDEVEAKPFGVSRIEPSPDSPHRRSESLYVEAVKT